MTETSFPWEDVATTETQFSQMFRNVNRGVNGEPTGDKLEVTAGFSGLTVDVAAGEAMVQGHYYINSTSKTLTLGTANALNPRIDTIVLRLDDGADSITAVVVSGTPAASPVPPTLTQTLPYGVYEFPLADVLVPAAATVPGTITDRREFMGERVGSWSTAGRPETNGRPIFGYNTDLALVEYYDGSTWAPIVQPINALGDITGVTIGSPANGESLVYNGSAWVNGYPPILETAEKTADYTIALADVGKIVQMNKSTTGTLTIPTNASVPFPIGSVVGVYNRSSSVLTLAGAGGVTVRNGGTLGQFREASLRKRGTDEWVVVGNVS
jgi:hypothetical protein